MKRCSHVVVRLVLALGLAGIGSGLFSPVTWMQTSTPSPRDVPARSLPVPPTVSPEMQALIGGPLSPNWNTVPKSVEEWKLKLQNGSKKMEPNLWLALLPDKLHLPVVAWVMPGLL